MNRRWFFLIAVAAASAIAGCGKPPSAKFVTSEQTKKLDDSARAVVVNELAQEFGDPNHLVAWQKLPIDFGEFDGVVESPGQSVTGAFEVRLVRKAESKVPLTPDAFKGAAIVWTSGENVGLDAEVAKGKTQPIDYQAVQYDPTDSHLRIRVLPAGAAGGLTAPQKGDKFTLIGPVLQHGRKLYMTNCEHCHGVSGDGNGPTAKFFDIQPRDYRQGIFKFTSTRNTDRARRDDLERTIRHGIPGTYMPSFLLFNDDEVGAIIEYVRWLSFRGQFEQKIDVRLDDYTKVAIAQREKGGETRQQIDEGLAKFVQDELPGIVIESGDDLLTAWTTPEQPGSVVIPKKHRTPDTPESRARGRKLFLSDTAKCATCHGPAGYGDGPQTEDYTDIVGTNKKHDKPGLFDVWENPIKPRDLTSGIYRGGRRPLDIYRRVFAGIKGTPMPPFGQALTDDQIWDLVNYALSLPYQQGPEQPQQPKVASASESASHGVGEN